MDFNEFIDRAFKLGLDLGKNPARTIRYYVDEGLLPPPSIEYQGKVKRAIYSQEHLAVLKLIREYKKEGFALKDIKTMLNENIYWSEEALQFMRPFIKANDYPSEEFQKNKPVTRGAFAVFICHFIEALEKNDADADFINRAFVSRQGKPAYPNGESG